MGALVIEDKKIDDKKYARVLARVLPRVIATGGLARQISGDSRYIKEIDDMLTLDGLLILFERNRAPRTRSRPR